MQNFQETLTQVLLELNTSKNDTEDEERKKQYEAVITGLTQIQENFNKVDPKEKVYLEVRIENSSRLSNYVNPQGILMFNRDEKEYSSIPQIIVRIDDDENGNVNAGKIDGYGVTAIALEANIEDLDADAETYTNLAFEDRSLGDAEYSLIFVIEDIKGRVWYEESSFSTFTTQSIKNELKSKGGKIFKRTNRPWFLSWIPL